MKTTECIIWTKSFGSVRYGQQTYQGKCQGAHRVAWQKAHGSIPDGMDVCHTCDHKACVNINHLFLGTRKDNMRDASRKGRARGMDPWKMVGIMARMLMADEPSGKQVAREYNVSPNTPGRIWSGIRRADFFSGEV